jgi:hypothetical protein
VFFTGNIVIYVQTLTMGSNPHVGGPYGAPVAPLGLSTFGASVDDVVDIIFTIGKSSHN